MAKTSYSGTQQVVEVPLVLQQALAKDRAAGSLFEQLSYSCKKEYIEWINSAKKETTRQARVEKTLGMLAAGRKRNEQYRK